MDRSSKYDLIRLNIEETLSDCLNFSVTIGQRDVFCVKHGYSSTCVVRRRVLLFVEC